MKGLLHLINEEFNASVAAFIKSEQVSPLLPIARDFKNIKPNDQMQLSVQQFIKLFEAIQKLQNNQFIGCLIHRKAYSDLTIERRIEFCKKIIKAHNQKSFDRYEGGKAFNFVYNTKIKQLDLSNNPWLQAAIILQNFPAISANLANTGIKNFICFRNQPLRSLNVSRTK